MLRKETGDIYEDALPGNKTNRWQETLWRKIKNLYLVTSR